MLSSLVKLQFGIQGHTGLHLLKSTWVPKNIDQGLTGVRLYVYTLQWQALPEHSSGFISHFQKWFGFQLYIGFLFLTCIGFHTSRVKSIHTKVGSWVLSKSKRASISTSFFFLVLFKIKWAPNPISY